jgi:phage tail sheath protein FI
MPTYLTPGVYVEEVETGARPIEGVGTTTAAFVGAAPKADARVNEPVPINSFAQFARDFIADAKESTPLANAVYGFFRNGGSRCYVVNIGGAAGAIAGKGKGLDQLAAIDEIAMIAAPGRTDAASYNDLLTAAETLGDRFAILDAPPNVDDVEQLTRVAEIDAAPGDKTGAGKKGFRARASERGFGALYYPWIRVRDVVDPEKIVSVPPSGHIAGICARTDTERGVHKAPANTIVRDALGVTQALTKAEHGVLNPAGVNALRMVGTEGVVVLGARTLAAAASNWRYINVRRLFNYVEESIAQSTGWVVFEVNGPSLWKQIRRDVGAFLTLLWRQGALMGTTPEQAFYVKCDAETNPPEVIDAGQVVVEIGMAPVKPAEFVVFRIGQSAAGASVAQA